MTAKKTKKPLSVVEMEKESNKRWAEKNKHERERVKILQRLGTGDLTQDEAVQLLTKVNDYERREQEQSARDDRAEASTQAAPTGKPGSDGLCGLGLCGRVSVFLCRDTTSYTYLGRRLVPTFLLRILPCA